MNIYAMSQATEAWNSLPPSERARSLATSYFAPAKITPGGGTDNNYKKDGIDALVHAATLGDYCSYWQRFLDTLPAASTRSLTATLSSQLLINLAGSVLENAGIALEATSGIPIIPGSAVKGAARRYALALLKESPAEAQEALLEKIVCVFGCVEPDLAPDGDLGSCLPDELRSRSAKRYSAQRGAVRFLQAVPEKAPKLCSDVLTPHHSGYMSGQQPQPTDAEQPIPSFFPAVEAGSSYHFTLSAPDAPELLDSAEEWLRRALELFGIGAKGAAGYGYFTVLDSVMGNFSTEERSAIAFIAGKKKLDDMFKEFHKKSEKEPPKHWALLRAVCLPETDPQCRLAEYRKFMHNPPSEKKARKNWDKARKAMADFAVQHHLTLPQV